MAKMVMKEDILESLKRVIDPELNINIVDLGLIYDIGIDGKMGKVEITMTLTTPGCPLSAVFENWIEDAVKKIDGVKTVHMNLVWTPPWSPEKLTDGAREKLGLL